MNKTEEQRVKAVTRFLNLKISRENELQGIVEMAAEICQTPVAMITFTDSKTQFVKYKVGVNTDIIKKSDTFCDEILQMGKPLVIPDLQKSEFANNPYVSIENGVRFYAGAPITTFDDLTVGTLCVLDVEPKTLTEKQVEMLNLLSHQIITIMEFDLSIEVLKAQYRQVKESENKLRSFFDSSVSCHFLLDREMRITAFNKTAARFVKTALNIKLKAGILMSDHVENVSRFSRTFNKALSGKVVKAEIEVHYKDGPVWWGIVCEPAFDSDGEIIGVSYNATDITEAKNNQKKISDQNELLRNIAFVQSHELRKPVASILGLMYLIKLNNYNADQEDFNMLENATAELDEKITSIVNQVEIS
ncbi:GAF domain-containing protein [Mucilaginibacter sp. AW1-3]